MYYIQTVLVFYTELNTKLEIITKRLHHSDRSNVYDIVGSLYHTFTQTSGLVVMNNWQRVGGSVHSAVCECAVGSV